jgi:hypothetical protein
MNSYIVYIRGNSQSKKGDGNDKVNDDNHQVARVAHNEWSLRHGTGVLDSYQHTWAHCDFSVCRRMLDHRRIFRNN